MYLLIRKESSAVSISQRFVTSNLYILRSKYKKKMVKPPKEKELSFEKRYRNIEFSA